MLISEKLFPWTLPSTYYPHPQQFTLDPRPKVRLDSGRIPTSIFTLVFRWNALECRQKFRWNSGLHFHWNSTWKRLKFCWNSGKMPAIIPAEFRPALSLEFHLEETLWPFLYRPFMAYIEIEIIIEIIQPFSLEHG